jgi:lactate dehydrogenase-like 2-hydroxyacid dehydrogenase
MIGKMPRLEIIAASGVGTDSIDVATAKTRGIRVTNTPNVLNDAVAEITIGLMVALSRRLPQSDRFVRTGEWLKGQYPLGREIGGKTLGILGLGGIGKEIARRAEAMKMQVVYFGRNEQPVPYRYYADLVEMARDVDWLVVIAPGGKGTERIVSRQVLEALGPDGMLVNVARGSLVDQEALVELLASGGLGGAALDVFDKEPNVPDALLGLDNVVLSPHQGGRSVESREAVGEIVVRNLVAHFSGKPLFSPVA